MKDSFRGMQKQAGFTLIEIAIVLVIIGLLVGGVLQGQSLIENARVKQAVKDFNGTAAAMFGYQDRYGAIPGDEGPAATINARGAAWNGTAGGNNGILTVSLNNTFRGQDENDNFWRQLKAAGFLSGNPADAGDLSLPTNGWGGRMGITTAIMGNGLAGTKVCMSEVPGSAAIGLDTQMDDGNGATGRVRATLGVAGANTPPTNAALAAAYNEDQVYSVCYRM
jgi:prepilin-type N-terminal cleavage/methylation domain-containing protein